jgi:exopolysaccharide biosynthesis polyprenyl glycosylphosphotransferase
MIWSPSKHRRYAQVADFLTSLAVYLFCYFILILLHDLNGDVFPPIFKPTKFDLFLVIVFSILTVAIFEFQKAYNHQRFTSISREITIVLKVVNISILLNIAIVFLLKLSATPRTFFIVYYNLAIVLLITEKLSLFYIAYIVRKRGANRRKVLLVGTGNRANNFIKTVKTYYGWGLDILGILTDDEKKVGLKIENIDVVDTYNHIDEVLKRINPEEVIITLSTKKFENISKIVDSCQLQGIQVRLYSDFFGKFTRNFKIDNIFGLNIISFNDIHHSEMDLYIKRILDIIISSLMLIILSPLFLVISILILVQDGFPILYKWNIVGYNRKPIRSWKFRTMVKNADELKKKLLKRNEMSGPVFKVSNDPRILPVGNFLRKHSFDELPQLYSVLKGDLSLVGPRPPLQDEFSEFNFWHRRKLSVKPGITCLWQISGRNEISSFDDWAKLDLEYIDNWTLWLDLKILLKTIPAVLSGKGAK